MARAKRPPPPATPPVRRKLTDRRIVRDTFPDVALRALAIGDLPQLSRWAGQPHVTAGWGAAHAVLPEIVRGMNAADTSPFVIIARGRPVGYLQIYAADGDSFWAGHDLPSETYGIDLFIGEPAALRCGYGSACLGLAASHLLDQPRVVRVHGDPGPDNQPSLRAFEKAGFTNRGAITTPDGPAIYMAIDRAA